MPWERRTVYQQRKGIIQEAKVCSSFSALCREFGITRRTGYKWLERCERTQPLTDRSRRPGTSPGRTAPEVEERILELRAENPVWGERPCAMFWRGGAVRDYRA